MNRALIALAALLFACGSKSKPAQLAPLPADSKPVAEAPAPTPAAEPETPAVPAGPLEVTVPATVTTVKLLSPGKGKKAPLRYSGKAGGLQAVELAVDFTSKQSLDGQSKEDVVPTVVLTGTAETKTVDAAGKAEYVFTVASADAREVTGAQVPMDKFKQALASLNGLVMSGSIAPDGTASDVTIRIEKPDALSQSAVDLIRLTLPSWPVLPTAAVGVGAKWRATSKAKLADQLDVTQITDYELVAHKGATWTIKGKTKVTGEDQKLGEGKISKISGSGSSDITLTDGMLYPTYKSSLETQFTASEGDKAMVFAIKVGGAVTATAK